VRSEFLGQNQPEGVANSGHFKGGHDKIITFVKPLAARTSGDFAGPGRQFLRLRRARLAPPGCCGLRPHRRPAVQWRGASVNRDDYYHVNY
jgi:hypothetical protein